jgi:hypothetical protein
VNARDITRVLGGGHGKGRGDRNVITPEAPKGRRTYGAMEVGAVTSQHVEHRFSAHDFAYLELRAARAYLARRIAIATVKQDHGLLTEEEQDALILAAAELKADIELWRQYR